SRGNLPFLSHLGVTVYPLPPEGAQRLPPSLEDASEPLEAGLPQAGLERVMSREVDQPDEPPPGTVEVDDVDAAEVLLEPRDLPLRETEHARSRREGRAPPRRWLPCRPHAAWGSRARRRAARPETARPPPGSAGAPPA